MNEKWLFEVYWDLMAEVGSKLRQLHPGEAEETEFSRELTLRSGFPVQAEWTELAAGMTQEPLLAEALIQLPFVDGDSTLSGRLEVFHQPDDSSAHVVRLRFCQSDNQNLPDLLNRYNQAYFEIRYSTPNRPERTCRLHVAFDPQGDLVSGLAPVQLIGEITEYLFYVSLAPQFGGVSEAASPSELVFVPV